MPSRPKLKNVEIPAETPPNNTVIVSGVVENRGSRPDYLTPKPNTCDFLSGDVFQTWKTPVRLVVNGETVDSSEFCLCGDIDCQQESEFTLNHSFSKSGEYHVEVQAITLREDGNETINSKISRTISVSETSRPPSQPSFFDTISGFIGENLGINFLTNKTLGIPNLVIILGLIVIIMVVS